MKLETLWDEAKELRIKKNASYILNLTLGCALILLGIGQITSKERTVLVPMGGGDEMWVEHTSAAPLYLERMAVFFVERLMNNTPSMASWNHQMALNVISPEYYGAFQSLLIQEEEEMQRGAISTSFEPHSVRSLDQLTVEVKGTLVSYVRGHEVKRDKKTYQVGFKPQGHTFLINRFTQEIRDE